MKPDISVVIPTYNRKDTLRKCLDCHDRQTFPEGRFEVIVVDDGSTDDTWEFLRRAQGSRRYPIHCFRKGNAGPGSARNLGISKARGEVLLFLGDDIYPDPNLLQQHWTWHTEKYPGDHVGVLGFVTWAADPPPSQLMIWLERGHQNAYHLLPHGGLADWRHSYTGNVSLKKRFLEETGERFDERLPPYGFEDIDWGYRLMKNGFELRYNRHAVGYHHHWVTVADSFLRMEKVGRSAGSLREVNPELHELVMQETVPKRSWERVLLPVLLHPFIARPVILPLARYMEHRMINSRLFALAHLYFFRRGLRTGT